MTEFDQTQIRRLDGGLLLVFRELLIRRRASSVANQLGLSASAISHALARLRDIFADPLFVRRSHGLEPTDRALELAPHIERLLQAMGEAVSRPEVDDVRASRRRFRIVCGDTIESLIGPSLVEAFRCEAPRATFTTRWAVLDQALRALRRAEVDLALGVFGEIPADLSATPLYQDEYCVIARQGHPQADGRVDRHAYATSGHVFVGNPDGALGHETPVDRQAIYAAYGALPGPDAIRTHAYVSLWESAMLIVAGTDAMADCPRRLATRYGARLGLQILDPPFRPFRFTVQAVRRGGVSDPGLDWLLEKIAQAVEA